MVAYNARPSDLTGALESLQHALGYLVNSPNADDHRPVLGEIGGSRAKIVQDIAQAGAELSEGVDQWNTSVGGDGIIPLSATAPVAEADVLSPVPTAIAGIALSAAISLGGLHFSSRQRRASVPAQPSPN
jgi:hypothetical protein